VYPTIQENMGSGSVTLVCVAKMAEPDVSAISTPQMPFRGDKKRPFRLIRRAIRQGRERRLRELFTCITNCTLVGGTNSRQ